MGPEHFPFRCHFFTPQGATFILIFQWGRFCLSRGRSPRDAEDGAVDESLEEGGVGDSSSGDGCEGGEEGE